MALRGRSGLRSSVAMVPNSSAESEQRECEEEDGPPRCCSGSASLAHRLAGNNATLSPSLRRTW
eukprot:5302266-Prymnesium_polylepis.1